MSCSTAMPRRRSNAPDAPAETADIRDVRDVGEREAEVGVSALDRLDVGDRAGRRVDLEGDRLKRSLVGAGEAFPERIKAAAGCAGRETDERRSRRHRDRLPARAQRDRGGKSHGDAREPGDRGHQAALYTLGRPAKGLGLGIELPPAFRGVVDLRATPFAGLVAFLPPPPSSSSFLPRSRSAAARSRPPTPLAFGFASSSPASRPWPSDRIRCRRARPAPLRRCRPCGSRRAAGACSRRAAPRSAARWCRTAW